MKQINTRRYGNYRITDNYFGVDCAFKVEIDMRVVCDHIFKRKHQQMTKILIPLCKNYTDRYHLNILRIIAIVYHIYIEFEFYS